MEALPGAREIETLDLQVDLDDFFDDDWLEWAKGLASMSITKTRRSIINYIAGHIVKAMTRRVQCEECQDMLQIDRSKGGKKPLYF